MNQEIEQLNRKISIIGKELYLLKHGWGNFMEEVVSMGERLDRLHKRVVEESNRESNLATFSNWSDPITERNHTSSVGCGGNLEIGAWWKDGRLVVDGTTKQGGEIHIDLVCLNDVTQFWEFIERLMDVHERSRHAPPMGD